MGSFANSLHVKSENSEQVAGGVAGILGRDGWRPTNKLPAQGSAYGAGPSAVRGLHISVPQGGWVSILDSEFADAQSLVPALAQQLRTHAIFFFVNDSDSWSYLLADPCGQVSKFDSAEAEDEEGEEGDLVETGAAIESLQALMRDGSLQERMQQVQQKMSAAAPPAIREAEARMRSGQGTAADVQQYQAWAMQEMPKHMAEMKSLLGGMFNPPRAAAKPKRRRSTKAERAAQAQQLDELRPILAAGVKDKQVQAVLGQKAVFAEEVLANFLPLVGIADYYANLSYPYLDEAGSEELTRHNIRFAQHLRLERESVLSDS